MNSSLSEVEQAGGISHVRKFVKQAVNVAGDAAGDVAVADAVSEDDAGDVVVAGEDGGEITAGIGAGRYGDDVGFQAGEFEWNDGRVRCRPRVPCSRKGAELRWCIVESMGSSFLNFMFETNASTRALFVLPWLRSGHLQIRCEGVDFRYGIAASPDRSFVAAICRGRGRG